MGTIKIGYAVYITDPLKELLAIKMYEHDAQNGKFPMRESDGYSSWRKLNEEDRQIYREIASGIRPLSQEQ
jgi:hypothetical protein